MQCKYNYKLEVNIVTSILAPSGVSIDKNNSYRVHDFKVQTQLLDRTLPRTADHSPRLNTASMASTALPADHMIQYLGRSLMSDLTTQLAGC
jgi:hypothetical protein